jgi:hypothetical protein
MSSAHPGPAASTAGRVSRSSQAGLLARPSLSSSADIAKLYRVKSTFDINDALLARAKRHAKKLGKPLRELVEEGLRRVLDEAPSPARYELPDRAVGSPGGPNPLERFSWQDLRDEIYGGR